MILAICMAGPIAHPSSAGTAAKIAVSQARPAITDLGVGLQRAAERLRAHLADKMRRLIYVSLTQRHHAVDRGHATGTHRFLDERAGHVGAEAFPLLSDKAPRSMAVDKTAASR